jgi:hypothetical protein
MVRLIWVLKVHCNQWTEWGYCQMVLSHFSLRIGISSDDWEIQVLTNTSDAFLLVSDSTSHSLPPPAPSPRFWHFISEYMDRWLTVSRFRLGDHHCRWENLICMHGGEQGDKLRKPPLSSSGLYLGLWQPWKGWYRFLTLTLTIGSAAFNLNPWTFQQCCRNVGPVSPWISGYFLSNATPRSARFFCATKKRKVA